MPQHQISLRRSLLLALGWTVTTVLLGPITYGLWSAVDAIVHDAPSRQHLLTLPILIFGMAAYVLVPAMFYGAILLPILIVWALIARTHRTLESARGVILGTLAIALFAGSMEFVLRSYDSRPLAPHGFALAPDCVDFATLLWIALVLPRLVVPQLRIGKFRAIS